MPAHSMNDHSTTYRKRAVLRRLTALAVFALAAIYVFASEARAAEQNHIGLNQRVLARKSHRIG